MKYLVVLVAVLGCALAQTYNPYDTFNQGRYDPFGRFKPKVTPPPFVFTGSTQPPTPFIYQTTVRPFVEKPIIKIGSVARASEDRVAEILRYDNDINPDGSFHYSYETNNGIAAEETGVPKNLGGNPPVIPSVVQGSFQWITPEGKLIAITYEADENGYRPVGDAIPTSPPIPLDILRSLEYNAKNAPPVKQE